MNMETNLILFLIAIGLAVLAGGIFVKKHS